MAIYNYKDYKKNEAAKKIKYGSPSKASSSSGSGSSRSNPAASPTPTVYVPKVGDVTNAAGELVRTIALKRPGGGYYSKDSPETVSLNKAFGIVKPDTPKSSGLAPGFNLSIPTGLVAKAVIPKAVVSSDEPIKRKIDSSVGMGISGVVIAIIVVVAVLVKRYLL